MNNFDNIYYLKIDGSKIYSVDKDNKQVKQKMSILKSLPNNFKQVHELCYVNTNHVFEYNWANAYFKLDNGALVNLLTKKFF